jgi:hypothetical protein
MTRALTPTVTPPSAIHVMKENSRPLRLDAM